MQITLATLSHEIRNPLAGLLSVLHVLRRTTLDEQQQNLLDTASNASHTLLSLLDDVLLRADFQENIFLPHPQVVLLHETVQTLLQLFSCQAQDKGILLIAHICPTLPTSFVSDAGKIQQILSNFLSNALRFTDGGIIKLQVSAEKRPTGNTALCFRVIDSGVGISSHDLQRIMESSVTTHRPPPRRGGTGLGLAISHQLAQTLGGSLHIHSEEGRGSIFTLSLPWQEAREPTSVDLPLRHAARISYEP
ncbi:MAG: HAMP domain-containing sensor histidine kinase [Pseudomonadales bacterium]